MEKEFRDWIKGDLLDNLIECYITVEGYTDLRSILSVMSQEYPGEFDRKLAIRNIREALKANVL